MKKIQLLLVDDEAEFRLATAQALEKRGFVVTDAESGDRALELLAASPLDAFDVMVLDLRMPGRGGLETLRELRQRDRDLPVLILTGHGRLDDALGGIRLGIIDFLQKPIEMEELASRVRQLLETDGARGLRERSLRELIVPAERYPRLYLDQPIADLLRVLRDASRRSGDPEQNPPTRTVLVFDRSDRFCGCVRMGTVLEAAIPDFLRDNPYATFLTGMFLAQSKLLSTLSAADVVEAEPTIDVRAPPMEALHLMASHRISNLPVLEAGALVGILRDQDLVAEIATHVAG